MPKQSAGILPFRIHHNTLQVFLVHPGGPFWKNKDAGVWSIAKGEYEDNEEPIDAAKREFTEETGQTIDGEFTDIGYVKYKNGKVVRAWAVAADVDEQNITSNVFKLEWPPKSGKMIDVEEVDRAGWFDVSTAKEKIIPAQAELIANLQKLLDSNR
ncbi:NUDIX domain-containing protein [Mucilaginibacter terrenus]|uniref:NUDIX domain-containing protein n=1 Tax=Mucilaginibacter terrenus TaxID=2482727 RepID=A0A3E2NYP8_9SPHI|nr:NUDIX domain-containing protein [Mucilaginibacter terrenus]RFZ86049.1 NUDIX domain-containing protein [Mucilaginibacter terrenus]